MVHIDFGEDRYLCENCEKLGIRTVLRVPDSAPENVAWYKVVMLRKVLEDHAREHNNRIVKKLTEVLNVERYEVRVMTRKSKTIPLKKPKRMIQT